MRLLLLFFLLLLPRTAYAVISGGNPVTSGGNSTCDTGMGPSINITPPVGGLLVICATTEITIETPPAAIPVPSTGSGLVFTQVATALSANQLLRVTFFTAPGDGVLTNISVGVPADQNNCTYSAATFTGHDPTTPIRQSDTAASAVGAGGLTVPISAAFGDAVNNVAYACFGHNTTNALTIAAPLTLLTGSSGCCGSRTTHGWKVGQESFVSVSGTTTGSTEYVGISAELNIASAPASGRRRFAPQHQSMLDYFLAHFFVPAYPGGAYVAG